MKIFRYPKDRRSIGLLFRHKIGEDEQLSQQVRAIISRVAAKGDIAVAQYTRQFDGIALKPKQFRIPASVLQDAWAALPVHLRNALKTMRTRIWAYHEKQKMSGFVYADSMGNRMTQRIIPLKRVGVYAPGGTAAYPSSVLMNALPARIAGVDEVVLLTPPGMLAESGGQAVLAAAHLAGVDEVIGVSGTAGIAALALGTQSIRKVDKIVGPGNKYVAAAKRLLFGEIDIDMIAGPSEIFIIADGKTPVSHIAADMLSQAEHDPDAQAIVVLIGKCNPADLCQEISRQIAGAQRRKIIQESLHRNGAIILADSVDCAVELANQKAPEHLEIMAAGPRGISRKVCNAAAIFLGRYTPEAIGDYVAGPNHTLPTGGTARFFSPLSVYSFLKISHTVEFTRRGFLALADTTEAVAKAEGLFAHAASVMVRR